jgi:hypothetical protein
MVVLLGPPFFWIKQCHVKCLPGYVTICYLFHRFLALNKEKVKFCFIKAVTLLHISHWVRNAINGRFNFRWNWRGGTISYPPPSRQVIAGGMFSVEIYKTSLRNESDFVSSARRNIHKVSGTQCFSVRGNNLKYSQDVCKWCTNWDLLKWVWKLYFINKLKPIPSLYLSSHKNYVPKLSQRFSTILHR